MPFRAGSCARSGPSRRRAASRSSSSCRCWPTAPRTSILEPFAGAVFAMTPGAHDQALRHPAWRPARSAWSRSPCCGTAVLRAGRSARMRNWTLGGCVASAIGDRGARGRRAARPGLADRRDGLRDGRRERRLRHRGHRRHDAARRRRPRLSRGRPDGALGRRAGDRLRARRPLGRRASAISAASSPDRSGPAYAAVFLAQAVLFLWAAHLSRRVFDGVERRRRDAAQPGRSRTARSPASARVTA